MLKGLVEAVLQFTSINKFPEYSMFYSVGEGGLQIVCQHVQICKPVSLQTASVLSGLLLIPGQECVFLTVCLTPSIPAKANHIHGAYI